MESIVINPKTKDEANAGAIKEKEDMGLLIMMKESDRNEKVSREEVMKKLNS